MPALSPTMTEGGISGWKIKEGESFNAGDIILEIETDKAQMDVEAQDDGILVKIYKQEGEKGITVGTSIGVIAGPDDEISSLTLPEPVSGIESPAAGSASEKKVPVPAASVSTSSVKEHIDSAPAPASSTLRKSSVPSNAGNKADPNQVLFPSVLGLLEANHLSVNEAIEKIPASGPKGRITKGDVLAYVGKVDSDLITSLNKLIKSREHLDLSNIKVAKSEPKPEKPAKEAAPVSPVVEKPRVKINFNDLLTFKTSKRKFFFGGGMICIIC
ncbi:hypothetical protein V1514DRAFT_274371 [Lipomyces japonicus]|uniref:uncharacterized protein n=1 Tax=Lipomyces japonicus TaxID=56871 RepID=UPI0034CFE1AE